ncbi:MAG: hypothetical protein ABF289_15160 [Clostridiales bacterium]
MNITLKIIKKNRLKGIVKKLEAYDKLLDTNIAYRKELNSKTKNYIVNFTFSICVLFFIIGILYLILGGVFNV